jgi:hypothetical protein
MKVGDLVTISPYCAPPALYGLGVITEITLKNGETGEPLRARVYWRGLDDGNGSFGGTCAVKYLQKVGKE